MSKKGSSKNSEGSSCVTLVLFILFIPVYIFIDFIFKLFNNFGLSPFSVFIWKGIIFVLLGVLAIIVYLHFSWEFEKEKEKRTENYYRGIRISQIDMMEGIEFENYLQRLLVHQGYEVKLTPASGDFGVDLVASRNGETIAIQAKRQNSAVSRRAISDAVAGMNFYNCTDAMVITNNYFTPDAKTLADSNNCTLIDRNILALWINKYQTYKTRIETPNNVISDATKEYPITVTIKAQSDPVVNENKITVVQSSNKEKQQSFRNPDDGDRQFEKDMTLFIVGGFILVICVIILYYREAIPGIIEYILEKF